MITRLANVIFYFFLTCAAIALGCGVSDGELYAFMISVGAALACFVVGWSIRYVLSGETKVAGFEKAKKIGIGTISKLKLPALSVLKAKARSGVKTLTIVAVAIISFGVVKFLTAEMIMNSRIETAIEKLQDDSKLGAALKTFQDNFPVEYNRFIEIAVKSMRDKRTSAEARAAGFYYMQDFTKSHIDDLVKAPSEDLKKVLSLQLVFIKDLQKTNVRQCADYGMRGLKPSDVLSETSIDFLGESLRLQIIAMRHGMDHPSPKLPVSEALGQELGATLIEVGASIDLVTKGLQGGANMTLQEQCDFSVFVYEALNSLPESSGVTLFASILPQAMQQSQSHAVSDK
ncbi:MAG: hypothetical protein IT560_07115 [Alphaproteobacteria bacterium]|nr:hypothetical protein [Alphaproteobacteria bacterium]